jgi:hypothetical protein
MKIRIRSEITVLNQKVYQLKVFLILLYITIESYFYQTEADGMMGLSEGIARIGCAGELD